MFNFKRVINCLIYGLVFFLPLFFLPIFLESRGIDNYHKSFLLFLIVPLVFIFYVIQLKTKKLKFNISDFFILIFLFFFFISSVLSVDLFSSFFGGFGFFGFSFLTLISLILFYFLILNFLKKKDIVKIFRVLLISFSFIVIWFILILYGVDGNFVRWFEFSQGSFEDLAVLVAFFDILLLSIMFRGEEIKVFTKYSQFFLAKILLVTSFLLLIFINFAPAWWCFLLGLIFLVVFDYFFPLKRENAIYKNKKIFKKCQVFFKYYKRKIFIIFLFCFSLLFVLFNFSANQGLTTNERVSRQLQLSPMSTVGILKDFRNKDLFLGSGAETFKYVFSKFRDIGINDSPFWHLRFNSSASHIFNLYVSSGLCGLLSYFSIFLFWGYLAIKFVKKDNKNEENINLFIITATVLIFLFLAQFVYSANVNLLFLFWLFLGLNMLVINNSDIQLKIKNCKFSLFQYCKKWVEYKSLFVKSVMLLLFLVWFIFLGHVVKYWVADYYFSTRKPKNMNKAIVLNPNRYNYYTGLARYHLNSALKEIDKNEKEKDSKMINDNFQKSIFLANQAIELLPDYVAPYETLAIIYRQIGQYADTYEYMAIDMFRRAIALEPSNPVLLLELGKLLMDKDHKEAVSVFKKAGEIKKDYFDADFYLAKSYINAREEKEALFILEKLLEKNSDYEIYYEQGRAYYNMGDFGKAINSFRQVISVSPIHANALYSLGISFEQLGDRGEALYFFKKVLSLNPENKELKKKIEQLKND